MKGIYVIAIASLASWAVSAEDQLASKEDGEVLYDGIPTVCPYPREPNEHNTTTHLPHETDCTLFYKCHRGRGILMRCPLKTEGDPVSRLHYNRLLQVCDWPWQAGCESCPNRYRNGTYPSPSRISHKGDNCNRYIQCENGNPSERYCSYGCFSRTCQECVSNREGGRCPWGPTSTGSPPTSSTHYCIVGDKKAHECDCGKYYECIGNTDWIVQQCTYGLHFRPSTKSCVRPNEAGCWRPSL